MFAKDLQRIFVFVFIAALLAMLGSAAPPNPGHAASEVSGGTFSSGDGDFSLPSGVNGQVGGNMSADDNISLPSTGFIDSITQEDWSIYFGNRLDTSNYGSLYIKASINDATGLRVCPANNCAKYTQLGYNGNDDHLTLGTNTDVDEMFLWTNGNWSFGGDLWIEGGRVRGSNGEHIAIGETDDMIEFQGVGGTDNTDLRLDLDGSYPELSSGTDGYVGFSDDLYLASGIQINFSDDEDEKAYWWSATYGTGYETDSLTQWSAANHRYRVGGTSVSGGNRELQLTGSLLNITDDLTVSDGDITGANSIVIDLGELDADAVHIQTDDVGNYDDPDLVINSGGEGNIRLGQQDTHSGFQIFTNTATYPHALQVQAELNPDAGEYEMFVVMEQSGDEAFSVIHGAGAGIASQFYGGLSVGAVGDNSPTVTHIDMGQGANGDLLVYDDVEINGELFVDGTGTSIFDGSLSMTSSTGDGLSTTSTAGSDFAALRANTTTADTYGIWATSSYDAIYASGSPNGVNAFCTGGSCTAVSAVTSSDTGVNYGLYGSATGSATTNNGVAGQASGATTNYAGFFSGPVNSTGGNWDMDTGNITMTQCINFSGGGAICSGV